MFMFRSAIIQMCLKVGSQGCFLAKGLCPSFCSHGWNPGVLIWVMQVPGENPLQKVNHD